MRAASLCKLHRATDRHTAELISITPMQAGGYVAGAPTADPADVWAYVTETSTSVRTSGNNANSGHNPELLGATHTAKFSTSHLSFKVETGFVLTRYDCNDPASRLATERYRVSTALPFGTDRTVLLLVKIP